MKHTSNTFSQTILRELDLRGLLFQASDRDELESVMREPITLYQGFDPTADSLHVGNLLGILVLRRFQLAGHHPIAVVGGGTGLIGDPSGRSSERQLNPEATVAEWTQKIRKQLGRFLDFNSKTNPAKLVNNYEWLSKLDMITYLRDIGKHFSVNEMLQKESVETRLRAGISYTEFSYMVLQSYDFLELYKRQKCVLQIGGSDQWGNISAGVSFIRKVLGENAFALTIPLVATAEGKKFGKSEGNAVWLDARKTSPYLFYQFWINTDDRDVVKFLNYYTFLSQDEIFNLKKSLESSPEKREAQRALAFHATKIVHGEETARRQVDISRKLFGGDISSLSKEDLREVFAGAWSDDFEGWNIVDFLLHRQICSSKRQAREDVQNGAISVNGEIWRDKDRVISKNDLLQGKYFIVRRGKRDYHLSVCGKALSA